MAGMDAARQARYYEELRRIFRERFPQLVSRLDDPTLLDRIAVSVQRARAYGVRTGEGLMGYTGLALMAGPAFHEDPKIRRFFEETAGNPDLKVRWLFERSVERLQAAANAPAQSRPEAGSKG